MSNIQKERDLKSTNVDLTSEMVSARKIEETCDVKQSDLDSNLLRYHEICTTYKITSFLSTKDN